MQTPTAEEPVRRSRDKRPRAVVRRKLPGFFGDDSAVQIERLERHDVLPTVATPAFSLRTFFTSMATSMSISVFTLLGLIVTANAAVDAFVIPRMGPTSIAPPEPVHGYPAEESVPPAVEAP